MSLGNPLAGLTMPPGDPAALAGTASGLNLLSDSVLTVSARQTSSAGAVIGSSWISNNATQAHSAIQTLANSAKIVASASDDGRSTITGCASKWSEAKTKWSRAEALAAEALAEEAAHRAAGVRALESALTGSDPSPSAVASALGAADGSDGYQSPKRAQARTLGEEAVSEANRAITTATARLYEINSSVSGKVPALMTAGAGTTLLAAFVSDIPEPGAGGDGADGPIGGYPSESIGDLIDGGTPWTGNYPSFGPPDGVFYRVDANGNVTSYAYYDQNGYADYRVDLYGSSHNGIDTPHVQEADWNQDPAGNWHQNGFDSNTQPATSDQIPWDDIDPDGPLYSQRGDYGNSGSDSGSGGDGSGDGGSSGGDGGDGGFDFPDPFDC